MAFRLTPWKGKSKNLPARQEQSRDPFTALQREMNRLFEEFHGGFDLAPFGGESREWTPRVDVTENEKEVCVSVELPGMDEKDIDVSLADNVLTIKGQKEETTEDKGKNHYRVERVFGSFHRDIPLPAGVEMDKADASFKKGVLSITLPKSKEVQKEVKKIPISTT